MESIFEFWGSRRTISDDEVVAMLPASCSRSVIIDEETETFPDLIRACTSNGDFTNYPFVQSFLADVLAVASTPRPDGFEYRDAIREPRRIVLMRYKTVTIRGAWWFIEHQYDASPSTCQQRLSNRDAACAQSRFILRWVLIPPFSLPTASSSIGTI